MQVTSKLKKYVNTYMHVHMYKYRRQHNYCNKITLHKTFNKKQLHKKKSKYAHF